MPFPSRLQPRVPPIRIFPFLVFLFLLAGCFPAQAQTAQNGQLTVTLAVDGTTSTIRVSPGTTVQGLLGAQNIQLSTLDRVEPPAFTVLSGGETVRVVRVREEFEMRETTLPFERQTVRNESLPEGQTMLIQPGVNGQEQITYRKVFENGKQVSESVFQTSRVTDPRAEIMMVGVQQPFTPLPIPGQLVYLTGGNAWMMERDTGNRIPLVTTGDLDGRIFSLSPDATALLFTRKSNKPAAEEINTLWMVSLAEEKPQPVFLRASNIVHYADWVPGRGLTVAYSTVEPRAEAPGWQADNNLIITSYAPNGMLLNTTELIPPSLGGSLGWWGTTFAWSPDGAALAYARPDEIGLVDIQTGAQQSLVPLLLYETRADWAWVPGLSWSPDHTALYTLLHTPKEGVSRQETSPRFDLAVQVVDGGPLLTLARDAGMFAYPVVSPSRTGGDFQVAYLEAIFPEQSDTGRYRLTVMDRDGSNRAVIFPGEGLPGLDPQTVVWSPKPFEDQNHWIALTYQKNIWLINSLTGKAQQVTGDGLVSRVDW